MKTRLWVLLLPTIMMADNLSSMLDFALKSNQRVHSYKFNAQAKEKELESSKSGYYPTLDIGGSYTRMDDRTPFRAGDTYSTYATVGIDLYSGGKTNSDVSRSRALLESSKYEMQSYTKNLQLEIVSDFYKIKSIDANLNALEDKKSQLQAELDRVKKFYDVGSVTIDDVSKLQAEYSNNNYLIEQTKYQILSLKQMLGIKVGKKIQTLEESNLVYTQDIEIQPSDTIKSLESNSDALKYTADGLGSIYMPQVRLEDTYSFYKYGRDENLPVTLLDNQNSLMLSVNIRLFDNGASSKQKESTKLQEMALQQQIDQLKDIQMMNVKLSLSKIKTVKAQITSASQSLKAANSTFEIVSKKFVAGTIDNVAYLDALSVKTNAKAQYATALNDLQIAYASYYFYTNKDIKDYVK